MPFVKGKKGVNPFAGKESMKEEKAEGKKMPMKGGAKGKPAAKKPFPKKKK